MVAVGTIDAARDTSASGRRSVVARTPVRSSPARRLAIGRASATARGQPHDELGELLQRAVLERAAAGGPLLQRKIGFEAEIMAPSFGPSHNQLTYEKNPGAVTDEIKSFLDGGVPYGTNIGGKGQAIRIDSDHGSEISREPIVDKLRTLGYVEGQPEEPRTKLEYVTHAIDELAPGSNRALLRLAKDLKDKLAETLKDAKSGDMHQLAAPAEDGYLTGVPVADLKTWLGTDYAQIKPLVKDFIDNRTADSVYLQATVGIIPSGMRTFLEGIAQPGPHVAIDPPSAARRKVLGIVKTVIDDLEHDKAFANHKWVKGLGDADHEAFLGILSLVYTYLLGDVLHKTSGGTSSTAKNAVPFLIKHGPWKLVALAGTNEMRDNPPPRGLARTIGKIFKKSKYLQLAYWVETGAVSAKKEGLIKKPLKAQTPSETFLEGDYVDIVEALLGSKETLFTRLRDKIHTPHYAATLGKELPGMDKLPTDTGGVNIRYESYGQRAIPLEFRWIQKRYKVSDLAKPMFEIAMHVRHANALELDDDQKRAVVATFNQ